MEEIKYVIQREDGRFMYNSHWNCAMHEEYWGFVVGKAITYQTERPAITRCNRLKRDGLVVNIVKVKITYEICD